MFRWRATVCTDRRGRLFLLGEGGRRCHRIAAVRGRCRRCVVSTLSDKPHSTLDKVNQKKMLQTRPPKTLLSYLVDRGREEDDGIMTKNILSTKNILLQITSNSPFFLCS